jgi:hypothetical protein
MNKISTSSDWTYIFNLIGITHQSKWALVIEINKIKI